uniref:Uncharacterized protein n=1 Tax=Plectus sambesii TaxID=2011161 RepID=A0A914WTB0_9BILA
MQLTAVRCLRRILNSPYDPYYPMIKSHNWMKRERTFRYTAWSYGAERDIYKNAMRRLQKIFLNRTIQAKDDFPLEKHWSQERVIAGLEEHRMEYKHFRNMLDESKIALNNKMLSQLAIYEPRTFKSLVLLTKQMAFDEGRPVVMSPKPENVMTEGKLFSDEPIPRKYIYRKGPAQDHTTPPRKLKPEEY